MKALSLWNPWAMLVAIGAKTWETRHWRTNYRGPIAIHASKMWTRALEDVANSENELAAFKSAGISVPGDLKFGGFVATAELTEIITSEEWMRRFENGELDPSNYAFGNFEPGRYAWKFESIHRLPEVIPFKGRQNLWPVTQEIQEALRAA